MEIRQVRYFLAVVDTGTFSGAAESLFIAQSSVSEQVARLERSLGAPLFDRSRRLVRLTATGEAFVPAARSLLVAHDAARDAVRPAAETIWRIAPASGSRAPLTSALRHLRRSHAAVSVEIHDVPAPERVDRVSTGTLDAAVVHGAPPELAGLVALPLGAERLYVVLGPDHPLAARRGAVACVDLEQYELAVASTARTSAHLRAVVAACREAGFEPRVRALPSEVTSTVATSDRYWTYRLGRGSTDLDLVVRPTRPAVAVPTFLVARAGDEVARAVAASISEDGRARARSGG